MSLSPPSYDVFLSYNSRVHASVERVARWLKEQGLTCFLDRWYLVPGTSWQFPASINSSGTTPGVRPSFAP